MQWVRGPDALLVVTIEWVVVERTPYSESFAAIAGAASSVASGSSTLRVDPIPSHGLTTRLGAAARRSRRTKPFVQSARSSAASADALERTVEHPILLVNHLSYFPAQK